MNDATLFAQLVAKLHHAPELRESWSMAWTPDGGETGDKKRSYWLRSGENFAPPASWLESKNVYFGVNPSAVRREIWQRSTIDTIGALNCFLAEWDGTDFVKKHEWLPYYVEPDLEAVAAEKRAELAAKGKAETHIRRVVKAARRGALQRAQTAAVDAAYKANPAEYLSRAEAHVLALPVKPTAIWASGGGYQGVWLFDRTVYLYNPDGTRNFDNFERMRSLYRKWVAFVGADPAASDFARVLRWVGSKNFKPKYAPNYPTVSLLDCDLDRVYNLDDLIARLPADEPKRERRKVHTPKGVSPKLANPGELPELPKHPAIDKFNRENDLRQMLLDCGYTEAPGGRLSRPGGDSGGVDLRDDNTAWIYSSADPLFSEKPVTPAHVAVMYWHDGNLDAFLATLPGHTAFRQAVAAMRHFVTHTRFEPFIDPDLVCVAGYRTDSRDTKAADALLDLVVKHGSWTFVSSKSELKRRMGVSSMSPVNGALACLTPWFVTTEKLDDSNTIFTVNVEIVRRSQGTEKTTATPCDLHTTYSTEKAKDVWQTGAARWARRAATEAIAPVVGPHPLPNEKPPSRRAQWLDDNFPKGYGETALRVVYLLEEMGEATRKELAEASGKSEGSIAAATRRLEQDGILEAEREHSRAPAIYSLADNYMEIVEEMAPRLRTHKMGAERDARSFEGVVRHLERTLARHYDEEVAFELPPDELEDVKRKRAWAKKQWFEALRKLHPDWKDSEINKFVDSKSQDIKQYMLVSMKLEKMRKEEQRRTREILIFERQRMRREGIDPATQRRQLLHAGYTVRDLQHVGLGWAA